MRGHTIRRTWKHDPTLYAPPRYRRACSYAPFIPDPLAADAFDLSGEVAGRVAEAERMVIGDQPHSGAGAEVAGAAVAAHGVDRVVEGRGDAGRRAAAGPRGGARRMAGRSVGSQAAEILNNIDAMQFAVERVGSFGRRYSAAGLCDIHRALLAPTGRRTTWRGRAARGAQNWIGGNDYNPCGADYVPPPAGGGGAAAG